MKVYKENGEIGVEKTNNRGHSTKTVNPVRTSGENARTKDSKTHI